MIPIPVSSGSSTPSAQKVLLTTRIIWGALTMGQLMFLGVLVFVILPQVQKAPPQPQPILVWVAAGVLIAVVPALFLVRMMIFQKSDTGGGVAPQAFVTGNIVFWAGCEGSSFLSLVTALVNGTLWPTILFAAAALALQAATFPTGANLADPTVPKP